MSDWILNLPHVNASLNAIAFVLLVIGYSLIKNGREAAHRRVMICCFFCSCLFLASYLTYHYNVTSKKFPREDYATWIGYGYLAMLATHVVLAATVPFLAVATIWLGLTDRRQKHRKLARITFPIWVYVSITGVLIYLVLYWWCQPIT